MFFVNILEKCRVKGTTKNKKKLLTVLRERVFLGPLMFGLLSSLGFLS